MNKSIFIFLYLFKLSLLTETFIYYRPMSKKSIDFGDDVCYYEDISDNSQLKYVKGCPSGKSCQMVATNSNDQYNIHTCQVIMSVSKKESGDNCDEGLYECEDDLTCSSGKCSSGAHDEDTNVCTTIKKTTGGTESCITDSTQIATIGELCFSKDSDTSNEITYTHMSPSSKVCKELQIIQKESTEGQYYIKSKKMVNIYSIQDGNYVEQDSNEFCQSGFSLFFYGNGKMISSDSDTVMFKRCVTILALNKLTSSNYIIKFKISNGNEYIYDTSHLPDTYKSLQNTECDRYSHLFMTRLEILKYKLEEYKTNGESSNKYIKWDYLYEKPEEYLLYKDQIDVLDYLIQISKPSYIPERLAESQQPTTIPKTEPTVSSNTEQTNTEENDTESSELLNIKYLIILLFLFLF